MKSLIGVLILVAATIGGATTVVAQCAANNRNMICTVQQCQNLQARVHTQATCNGRYSCRGLAANDPQRAVRQAIGTACLNARLAVSNCFRVQNVGHAQAIAQVRAAINNCQ